MTATRDGLEVLFTSRREGNHDVFRSSRASIEAPFVLPVRVTGLSSDGLERCVLISPDGLEAFVCTDRSGSKGMIDIWRATRTDRGSLFGSLMPVVELNSENDDVFPALSLDGSLVYFNQEWVTASVKTLRFAGGRALFRGS